MKPRDMNDVVLEEGLDGARAILDAVGDPPPAEDPAAEYDRGNGADHADDTGLPANPVAERPPFIEMSDWDHKSAPPREWLVKDRIPLRQPTLISGEGAIGKTLILLQLQAAHVLARDWIGLLPEPGPAIYFGAEDDADELHRRLGDIAEHYGARFADLIAGGMHMLSYAGQDAILGAANRAGNIEPTPLFERLRKAVVEIRPKSVVLDTSADVYGGDEINRRQVRQFVGQLRRLGIDGNCAVILASHPSLTGINTGTGLSGSTGWHNSVRARAFFKPAETEQGDEPDQELRELVFLKNNYGPKGDRVLLRWTNGVFVPEGGAGTLDRMAADQRAADVFLTILTRFNRNLLNAGPNTGKNYAPTLFRNQPEAKGISAKNLEAAMGQLLEANKIHVRLEGPPSRQRSRLTVGPRPE